MKSLLRQAREARGLTVEEVAAMLGIPPGYYSQIERGERSVSAERAKQIASALGVSVEAVFTPLRYARRVGTCSRSDSLA